VSKIRNNPKYLAIVILIGGDSSRFGSDKGLFQISGKPLISYQLETLEQLNYDIFLVANSEEQVQEYINNIDIRKILAFIVDDQRLLSQLKKKTPLIGLYSAFKELNKLKYEKALVLPCDIPLVQKKVIEFLIEESKNYDCSIPQWNNGFIEPLIAVYPIQKSIKSIMDNISKGYYKLSKLLRNNWKINYISIEKSIQSLDTNLLSFVNINKQMDLEKIRIDQ
jgi:molybdopterin-guanine dinucleotide biosynthesis protein A